MTRGRSFTIVTIDGAAAVGKSSTSRGVADRLNFLHVDTGSHYRTLTHAFLEAGGTPDQPKMIFEMLKKLSIDTCLERRSAKMSINGNILTEAETRSPTVNAVVSKFATIEPLRRYLLDYQRGQAKLARKRGYSGLVMEGRDIGSVIFPDADYRFFLYADEATRVARRHRELASDPIAIRDTMDQTRKTAPLICPEGAISLNTGLYSLKEVIQMVCDAITS